MRHNSQKFNVFNQSSSKDLRLVVVIGFATPVYLSSHADIPNLPVGTITDTLTKTSSISQSLQPSAGRATIGSMSFSLLDIDGAVTQVLRNANALGEGSKGTKVKLYRGGINMDFAEFRLEQTQQIDKEITYKSHVYSIRCADIQRTLRKDICDISKTQLSSDLDAGSDVINVNKTTGFHFCDHVSSFSDMPTGRYLYLKIKKGDNFEIVRVSGKTATSFTGVVRGLFGTNDIAHIIPENSGDDNGVIIEEYIYIELPGPALAYALLTGEIIGGGTLPESWHLGLLPGDVNIDAFTQVGDDLFDQTDFSKGFIVRFEGLTKIDGKTFIEKEICLLLGMFMPVLADGRISLKRMAGVLSNADAIGELNEDNIISHGKIKYDNSKIYNELSISWAYMQFDGQKAQYYRKHTLLDAKSINKHGKGSSYSLSFKGLHSSRHTMSTVKNSFNALRDRYAGPPLFIDVKLMPSMNDVEVGDILRVRLPNQRDFLGFDTLDRSFEIQRISINQTTGDITASLFGSSEQASEVVDDDVSASAELPDDFYPSGQNIASLLSVSAGALQTNGTLTGIPGQRTVFYHLGDFTVPANKVLNVIGNVELRILGHLQVDGIIKTTSNTFSKYLGTTRSSGGFSVITASNSISDVEGDVITGYNSVIPSLNIINNAGVFSGLPIEMSGTTGPKGANTNYNVTEQDGGSGGQGGGSLIVISRGVGFGVSGQIDLSGEDGALGVTVSGYNSGTGGGGAPGCCVFLIDGVDANYPILQGNIIAKFGFCHEKPEGYNSKYRGKSIEEIDLGVAVCRVLYVPKTRTPYSVPEVLSTVLPAVDGLIYSPLVKNINHGLLSWKKKNIGVETEALVKIFDNNGDHVWVKYADDLSGTNLSNSATGKSAIGFSFHQKSTVKSNNPADYQFQVIDQINGYQVTGLQGEPRFLWVKYSNDLQGSSPVDTHAGSSYIGIALNKRASEKSVNAKDYMWFSAFGSTSLHLNESTTLINSFRTSEDELYLTGLASGKYRASVAAISDKDTSIFSDVLVDIPVDTFDALTPKKGEDYDDGANGKNGTHTSLIFRSSEAKPTKPAGGSYDGSSETIPTGYSTDPVYVDGKTTWVSKGIYVHDGVDWTNIGWSEPTQYIIKGPIGPSSTIPGPGGLRGSQDFYRDISAIASPGDDQWSNTQANLAVSNEGLSRTIRDKVTLYNGAKKFSETKYFDGANWVELGQVHDGNQFINGTVAAEKLAVEFLSAISANLGTLTGGSIYGALIATAQSGLRAQLTNGAIPLSVYNESNNLLFGTRVGEDGNAELYLRGSLADNIINNADFFTSDGLAHLRSRLGLKEPTASTGGTIVYSGDKSFLHGSFEITNESIHSGGASIQAKLQGNATYSQLLSGAPGQTEHNEPAITYTVQFYYQTSVDDLTWEAFVAVGSVQTYSTNPFVQITGPSNNPDILIEGEIHVSAAQSIGTNDGLYYRVKAVVTKTSGNTLLENTANSSLSSLVADEPLSGDVVLAHSHDFNSEIDNVPFLSATEDGMVTKGGSGITKYLRQDGQWVVPPAYSLPAASATVLGGVKISVVGSVVNITTS